MSASRTLDEIKATLTALPAPPNPDSQSIITDDLRRILDRSDKACERTETHSGALLAGLTALATFAASRIDLAAIDTDVDRALLFGTIVPWLLSVLMVLGVVWRGRHALGWDPESMVASSPLEPLDVRQQRIVELAIAVISSNRLANRKGRQFNIGVVLAAVALGCMLAIGITGGFK
jgi:hypothetical protein